MDEQHSNSLAGTNKKKPYSIWLTLLLIALVGVYASDLIPAFAGRPYDPSGASGAVVFTIAFFVLLWRRNGRSGWIGALLGIAVVFVMFFVSGFVRAYVRGHDMTFSIEDAVAKINKSVPQQVSEDARLDGAEAGPGPRVKYRMSLLKVADSDVDKSGVATFVKTIKTRFCNAASLKPLLDGNATVVIDYYAMDKKLVAEVELTRSICAQGL